MNKTTSRGRSNINHWVDVRTVVAGISCSTCVCPSHLSSVRLLAAPLAEVGHAALLQLRVQLHIQRPLVENPLNLHFTVPR